MRPTIEQIANWIEVYLQSPNATNVMNRKWEQMFIHKLHKENYKGYNGKAFEKLEPIQIEDFLCIYKDQLAGKTQKSPTGCCCS